jgi:hypothetical protein
MKNYNVEIHETSSRIVTVKAKDEDVAVDKVRELYEGSTYILDYNDFQEVEFNLL